MEGTCRHHPSPRRPGHPQPSPRPGPLLTHGHLTPRRQPRAPSCRTAGRPPPLLVQGPFPPPPPAMDLSSPPRSPLGRSAVPQPGRLKRPSLSQRAGALQRCPPSVSGSASALPPPPQAAAMAGDPRTAPPNPPPRGVPPCEVSTRQAGERAAGRRPPPVTRGHGTAGPGGSNGAGAAPGGRPCRARAGIKPAVTRALLPAPAALRTVIRADIPKFKAGTVIRAVPRSGAAEAQLEHRPLTSAVLSNLEFSACLVSFKGVFGVPSPVNS